MNNGLRLKAIGAIARLLPAGRRTFARMLWRLAAKAGTQTYRTSAGFRMNLDLLVAYQRDLCFGLYERESITWLKKVIRQGDIFFDVGANIGYFSLLASQLVGPNGHIFAYEPEPTNLDRLRENVAMNDTSNVTVCPFAVGNHSGTVRFVTGEDSVGSTLDNKEGTIADLGPEYIGTKKEVIDVPMTTLDHEFEERCATCHGRKILKMDIEGAEPLALKGAQNVLHCFDAVVIECNPFMLKVHGFSPGMILDGLTAHGFVGYLVKKRFGRLVRLKQELLLGGNWLFLKPARVPGAR